MRAKGKVATQPSSHHYLPLTRGNDVEVRLAFGVDSACTRLASTQEAEKCQSAVRSCLYPKEGAEVVAR